MEKEKINNYVKQLWCARHSSDIEKILKDYANNLLNDLTKCYLHKFDYNFPPKGQRIGEITLPSVPNSGYDYLVYDNKTWFVQSIIFYASKNEYELYISECRL